MIDWRERLYRLLPAVHQLRDGEQRESLRALLHIVGEQVQDVHDDIEQLYDNWFIETCQDWVVPYVGDLVGFRRVEDAGEPGDALSPRGGLLNRFLFPRREIANLVRRRRRKGTLSVLEDVARDVTSWPARAVDFSQLVAAFQNAKYPQPTLGRTLCVRQKHAAHADAQATANLDFSTDGPDHDDYAQSSIVQINTPFDLTAHTVDVREIQSLPRAGWYHPRKVGLFVWRRKVISATRVAPCHMEKLCDGNVLSCTFSRLGHEIPLYLLPTDETNPLGLATESNLPVPLYRHLLAQNDGRASKTYYGLEGKQPKSLAIYTVSTSGGDVELIPADLVHVCDLGDEKRRLDAAQSLRALGSRHVAVDPERGRFLLNTNQKPLRVCVSYHYAATAELGGGEYVRSVVTDPTRPAIRVRPADCCVDESAPDLFTAIANALQPTSSDENQPCFPRNGRNPLVHKPRQGFDPRTDPTEPAWIVCEDLCIEITDSGTFQIPAGEWLQIQDGKTLEIRASSGAWPLIAIRLPDENVGARSWRVLLGRGSKLILSGLLVCGATMEVEDAVKPLDCAIERKAGVSPSASAPCSAPVGDSRGSLSEPHGELHIRHTTFVPGGRVPNDPGKFRPAQTSLRLHLLRARLRAA